MYFLCWLLRVYCRSEWFQSLLIWLCLTLVYKVRADCWLCAGFRASEEAWSFGSALYSITRMQYAWCPYRVTHRVCGRLYARTVKHCTLSSHRAIVCIVYVMCLLVAHTPGSIYIWRVYDTEKNMAIWMIDENVRVLVPGLNQSTYCSLGDISGGWSASSSRIISQHNYQHMLRMLRVLMLIKRSTWPRRMHMCQILCIYGWALC